LPCFIRLCPQCSSSDNGDAKNGNKQDNNNRTKKLKKIVNEEKEINITYQINHNAYSWMRERKQRKLLAREESERQKVT
jgi:flagellar biosynthesis chaperone FliJ